MQCVPGMSIVVTFVCCANTLGSARHMSSRYSGVGVAYCWNESSPDPGSSSNMKSGAGLPVQACMLDHVVQPDANPSPGFRQRSAEPTWSIVVSQPHSPPTSKAMLATTDSQYVPAARLTGWIFIENEPVPVTSV